MIAVWCLIGLAVLMVLLALGVLIFRPRRPNLTRLHPGRLVRGCLAVLLLLVALGLAGLAVLATQQ